MGRDRTCCASSIAWACQPWCAQQLVDAIVVGQITFGLVFTIAAFAEYVIMAGPTNDILIETAGAAVSTLGIFLPSFFIFKALGEGVARMRQSNPLGHSWTGSTRPW